MKKQKNNLVIFSCYYWNPILLLYRLPLVKTPPQRTNKKQKYFQKNQLTEAKNSQKPDS